MVKRNGGVVDNCVVIRSAADPRCRPGYRESRSGERTGAANQPTFQARACRCSLLSHSCSPMSSAAAPGMLIYSGYRIRAVLERPVP